MQDPETYQMGDLAVQLAAHCFGTDINPDVFVSWWSCVIPKANPPRSLPKELADRVDEYMTCKVVMCEPPELARQELVEACQIELGTLCEAHEDWLDASMTAAGYIPHH